MAAFSLDDINADVDTTVSPRSGETLPKPNKTNRPDLAALLTEGEVPSAPEGLLGKAAQFVRDTDENINALKSGVHKGATFGLSDEINAVNKTATDALMKLMPDKVKELTETFLGYKVDDIPEDATMMEAYELRLNRISEEQDKLLGANPVAGIVGEVVGAIGTTVAAGGATGLTAAAAKLGVLGKTALASAAGATEGWLNALFEGEDQSTGAAIGMAGGLLGYPAAKLVGGAARKGKHAVQKLLGKVDDKTIDYLVGKLSAETRKLPDQVPWLELDARLTDLGSSAKLTDISQVLTDTVEDIASSPTLKHTAYGFMSDLAEQGKLAPSVLKQTAKDLFGTAAPLTRGGILSAHKDTLEIIGEKRAAAVLASNTNVPTNEVYKAVDNLLLPSGRGSSLNRRVAKLLKSKIASVAGEKPRLDSEALIAVRQEIDDMISGATKIKKSALKGKSRADILKVRAALNETLHIDEAVKHADGQFASAFQMESSVDTGMKVLKPSVTSADIVDFMKTSNPAMKTGFMNGVKRALVDEIEKAPTKAAKKLSKGTPIYNKLKHIMGEDTLHDLLISAEKSYKFEETERIMSAAARKSASEISSRGSARRAVDVGILASRVIPVPAIQASNVAAGGAAGRLASTAGTIDISEGMATNVMEAMQKTGGDASEVLMQMMQRSTDAGSRGGLPALLGGVGGATAVD